MSDAPVITIVTPSYNQGEFIEETLVSVLSQSGDFHLDYLVIDGASTDCSVEVIRRYAELVEKGEWPVRCLGLRFRWLSEADNGQSDALVKGFSKANGEIFAWLNSDDIYLPGTLKTVAAYFQAHPEVDLVYGGAHYCDAGGKVVGSYPTEAFDLYKLAWFNFFCQPSVFFRKKAYDAVGGVDVSLHYGMDYDLFIRLGKAFACNYLPKVFSSYRLHLDSKTMRDEILYANHEEALGVVRRHFGHAPLNLVYGSCYYYTLAHLPKFVARFRFVVILLTLFCTLPRSVWMNKGVRRNDLQLLHMKNLSKLFKDRKDVLLH